MSRDVFKGNTKKLLSLSEEITDCHHSTPLYLDEGKLVIRNFNIKDGRMVLDKPSFTDEEHFNQRVARSVPVPGDLIITREAPMGEVCVIPEGVECCLGQRMVLIKPDLEKVNNKYLLYSLMSEYVQNQINKSNGTGSIVSNLRIPVLKDLKIPYYDLVDQQKIAKVLSDLDAKIELNNKINAELEAMAKLIYDYWFVQFDFPDVNGKPYKSSGGAMVYNAELKREIPKGWEVKKLADIVDVGKDQVNPSDTPEKLFKHLSIPIFDSTGTYGVERGDEIGSNKFVLEENDIAVSKLNPWFNRVFYPEGQENLICTTEMVVWKCSNVEIKNFMYSLATSDRFIAFCTQSATGTSNSHKRVNPTIMMGYKLAFDESTAEKFGSLVNNWIQMILNNKKQNQHLSSLRDWLLPMLMNGQVRVG